LLATLIGAIPSVSLLAQEATGTLYGVVRDDFNGMTLPTVNIAVAGLDITTMTDVDGNYRLELPVGTHSLSFTFPGGTERIVTDVVIEAGAQIELDIVLRLAGMGLEETVVVTADSALELATAEAQLIERKRAGTINDNISRQEMRANADSDAASAMARVTGLSVVDDQYVFVRGLGERYSNTMLNGSVLPTTEPDKRVVPLDLIPTSLIESVQVVKSYSPEMPAEFSGGLIQIETVRSPKFTASTLSTRQTFNTQTVFKDNGLGYAGGINDWWGFDDGRRALPGTIPDDKVVRGSPFFPGRGYTRDELKVFGESFENLWEPRQESYGQDQDYSGSYGGRVGKLGFVASIGHRVKTRNRDEEQIFYQVGSDEDGNSIINPQNQYDFQYSTTNTRLGVLANFGFDISPGHQISWSNFWTHQSRNETRLFGGYNDDIREEIRNSRLFWSEESLLQSTLRGEHLIPSLANSRIDWRASYSKADRNEPDLRETLYEFNPARDAFVLADESQSGFRMFNDLQDEVFQGAADWSLFFSPWGGLPAQVKFGPNIMRRERDFASRRFRFVPINTRGIDLALPPEQLFIPENIGPHFELKEETRNTDAYTAQQDILALYAMVDLPLSLKLRFFGGLRVASSQQEVLTFDPFNVNREPIVAELDNTDALPSASLIYSVSNEMNIRAGYSRTVNRPDFRELSPFEFTDVIGGRSVVGNPNLRRALIDNLDLRWEWFVGPGEVLAASIFYKDFTDPIERIVQPTAQLRTSFTNALGATNKGFEIEARKQLTPAFGVNLNYTYVDSQIELEQEAGQVQTSLERALVGQSPHVVNAQAIFQVPRHELSARLLYNWSGRRITDVGSLGLPDIYEESRSIFDIILAKRFRRFAVQLTGSNLLNAQYRFTQGNQPQRTYKIGPEFALGVSYGFF
jgi:outer membrane receptor protein involved in Fe transport